jgi:hypothetical protein
MVSRTDESANSIASEMNAQRDVVETRAAIAHGQTDAQKAEAGHLGQQFMRESVVAVVLFDDGHHFFAGEVIGHLLDHFVFFGKLEVHRCHL